MWIINPFIVQIIFILVYVQTLCKALRVTKMPLECCSKYVFVPGYGYFKPRKMGFTNSIEHPHECAGCHAPRVDSPAARLLLLVCCTLGLHLSLLLGSRLADVLLLLGLLGGLARGLGLLLLLVV